MKPPGVENHPKYIGCPESMVDENRLSILPKNIGSGDMAAVVAYVAHLDRLFEVEHHAGETVGEGEFPIGLMLGGIPVYLIIPEDERLQARGWIGCQVFHDIGLGD